LGISLSYNDSISGTISLGSGPYYGNNVVDSKVNDDLELNLFNVSFADAFTEGLTVTFGSTHRTFGLDSNNLWYDPYWNGREPNNGASSEARNTGLFLDYASDNMTVTFGWSKMNDRDLNDDSGDDDENESGNLSHTMLTLTYGLDSVSEGSAIALGLLHENRAADINVITFILDTQWVGLVDGLDISLGLGLNNGDDHSGMRVRLGLNYDLGMDNGAWVGFAAVLATGDDGDDIEWQDYGSTTGAMNFNILSAVNGYGDRTQTNITSFAIGGGMSFDMGSGKNNAAVSLLVGMADQTEGDDSYGTEVDVNFDHTLNSNVAWGAHVGYLSSTDTYGAGGEDSEYQIVFPVTFTF
jgi:hypothetical protein